jgi:hypothetical protein
MPMVSAEEIAVYGAHDTRSLRSMLAKKEYLLVASSERGLSGNCILQEEEKVSVIKAELSRRGVLED